MVICYQVKFRKFQNREIIRFWRTQIVITGLLHLSHLFEGKSTLWSMNTLIWNVILWILVSQIHFHSAEICLGSQNWQDYISSMCFQGVVDFPSKKWDWCNSAVITIYLLLINCPILREDAASAAPDDDQIILILIYMTADVWFF